MKKGLTQIKSIGFIMSPNLGDALFSMIIPENLRRNGFKATVFNNYLYALRSWFPQADIQPWPDPATSRETLKSFDLLLYVYRYNDKRIQARQWHPQIMFLDDYSMYHKQISMADIQISICKELFGLSHVERSNGMLRNTDDRFRFYPQRVAIHPTASSLNKHWLPKKFVSLANQLQQQGYEPVFIVSPKEAQQATWIRDSGLTMIEPSSINVIAQYLHESGWFIGNDSGIGHLASSLGIPTVSLMSRKSVMLRWRPSLAPGKVLLPSMPLLLKSWKKNYWKYFVSVERVFNTFEQLTKEYNVPSRDR